MGGNRVSETGNKVGEVAMSAALMEARGWAKDLENRERFLTDGNRKSARFSIADKTGVDASYLFRLRYKWKEMNGVDGDAYRSLMLAYNKLCDRVDAAADHQKFMREQTANGNSTDQGSASAGLGMAAPQDGKSATKARVTPLEIIEPRD